ncbi:hypothetical protein [Anaerosporobacter faecicola]|uniref:hypothetical protein n=1 Tax=Anaerosporobacter faecicola TaxID=2718714 RepID=UPI0014391D13|nr:hypothetical protein [Anaerosporobacter faecicola]
MKKIWNKKVVSCLLVMVLVIGGVFGITGTKASAASKKKQTISVEENYYVKTIGDKSFNLNAKAKTTLTYKSSDRNVVTVSKKGKVTLKNAGEATITIKAASSKKYKSATVKVDIYIKSKGSTKNMVAIKLNDGTIINAGDDTVIPLSKLKESSFEIVNREKGMSYEYASLVSVNEYFVSEDPQPNWAYEGIALDRTNKKLVESWENRYDSYFHVVDVEKPIDLNWEFFEYAFGEYEEYNDICIFLQEVNADGTEGNYYYENNFKIDRTK